MNCISTMFVAACAAAAANAGEMSLPRPFPLTMTPILTRSGALARNDGHVQGICVSSNAIYMTQQSGIYKFDWHGRLIARTNSEKHQGDICLWNGRLYTAFCKAENVPMRGRIDVWDEQLNRLGSVEFEKPADGITCLDGVLYVGLGSVKNPKKPLRGNWFGKFDAETLAPLCEPFVVDHGFDTFCGVQNLATDGRLLYMNVYTPDEETPCFFVMDRNFKVISSHFFGWRHGMDVVGGGKEGAVRFIYAFTVNWLGDGVRLSEDPSLPQALMRYAELKDGRIRDITNYQMPRLKRNK